MLGPSLRLSAVARLRGGSAALPTGISANGVSWSWTSPRQAGVLPWGQAWIVVPSGDESLAEPGPAAGAIGGGSGSRAEINPAFPPAQAQGYDSRMGFYSAGRATTSWPAIVSAHDIIVKCVSAESTGEVRNGLADRYGALVVLPAPPLANTLGYVAVSWTGRTVLEPVVVDLDAALASYPSYALAGLGLAAPADVLAEIDRYWPTMAQIWGAGSTSGYQLAAPQNIFGSGAYGAGSMPSVSRALMHLIGDSATAAQKRAMLSRLIQFGADAYEARFRTPGNAVGGNGAHYQIEFVTACLYLHHTGRGDEIADLATTMGFNFAQQIFELTPAMIDALATPHDSATGPCLARRREVLSVSGLALTLEVTSSDPYRINFKGLELVRESDGATAVVTSTTSPDITSPFPVTIAAQPTPAFDVGDVITLRRVTPMVAGEAEYRSNTIGDDFEGFGGIQYLVGSESSDSYRQLCYFGLSALFLRAIGAFPEAFAAMEIYYDLNEDRSYPAGGVWGGAALRPHIFANNVEMNFSAAHKAAIRATPAGHAGRPAFFAADDWAAAPAGAGEIAVTIDALPDARGAALTAIEVSTDGGETWAELTDAPAVDIFTISGLTPAGAYNLAIRAVNAVGAGPRSFVEAVSAGGVLFATEPTVNAFATGPGGAATIFTGRRDLNSGLVFVSGAGQPGAVVQGRMVRASDGAAVSSWMDIATADAGDGSFEGWIEGAPRSFNALRAQVRYRDAGNAPAATSNTCFVGWVLSLFGQSYQRWLHYQNSAGVSITPTVALHDNRVRFVILNRDEITPAPVTESEIIVFDVAGSPPPDRDPMWRAANVLMETLTDGPIIFMGHAVPGTNDRAVANDSDTSRFWSDEVLVAKAGQPHLVEGSRKVALDLVYWTYDASASYTNAAQALGATGRIFFGVDPSGNPVAPGTAITDLGGSFNYIHDHSLAEIYDWTHSRVAFNEHPNPETQLAQEAFNGHPVYGQYVVGFPAVFSDAWNVNGTRQADGTYSDTGHPSANEPFGYSETATLDVLAMARALGRFTPAALLFDFIEWPEASGTSPYVYVGLSDMDVTTPRIMLAEQDPPVTIGGSALLGGALGFTVNGVRSIDTAIVTHGGFKRVRIGKPGGGNWTNADALNYDVVTINYAGIAPEPPEVDARASLARGQDFVVVPTGLVSKPATPFLNRQTAGFFANQIPAPPGPSLVHLATLTPGGGTAGVSASYGVIPSDGRPILLALGTRGTTNTENGAADFPTAITLGGVDILDEPIRVAQQDSTSQKATLYYIPSPAVGDLELVVTLNNNSFANIAKAYHVANGGGLGPVRSSVGGAVGPAVATTIVSSAGGSMLVNVITSAAPVTDVSGGAFVDPVTTVGSTLISMGVATTVVPGVGEKTTAFTVGTFAHGVRLGVEIFAPA